MRILIIILFISTQILASKSDTHLKLTQRELLQDSWLEYAKEDFNPLALASTIFSTQEHNLDFTSILRLKEMKASLLDQIAHIHVTKKLTTKEAIALVSEFKDYKKLRFTFSNQNKAKLKKATSYLAQVSKFTALTQKEAQDIFDYTPDLTNYRNGEYHNTLRLYLFCRKDRSYPCLFIMKDIAGNLVRNNDSSIWSLPALAYSRHKREFYQSNGNTPAGVHSIDSVMPEANKPQWYGKFRRAVLNWIPKSEEENETLHLLPYSSHQKTWWKQAIIARDNGRKWLRIHGTGNINEDPTSNYYPHFGTSGCISTREGKYDIEYKDQRILLNKMMEASSLLPIFTNEPRIKGLLYVIELDNRKKKVEFSDLEKLGLF